MSPRALSRAAAVAGILGGLVAIGEALYARSADVVFGIPGFMWIKVDFASGAHQLAGFGLIMVIGGGIAFLRPAPGIGIVCAAALIGLIGVSDRGRPIGGGDPLRSRWVPYMYYWAAPWVLAWISGIFAGLYLQKTVEQYDSPAEIDKPRAAKAQAG
jgi:hypothetical protein